MQLCFTFNARAGGVGVCRELPCIIPEFSLLLIFTTYDAAYMILRGQAYFITVD